MQHHMCVGISPDGNLLCEQIIDNALIMTATPAVLPIALSICFMCEIEQIYEIGLALEF